MRFCSESEIVKQMITERIDATRGYSMISGEMAALIELLIRDGELQADQQEVAIAAAGEIYVELLRAALLSKI